MLQESGNSAQQKTVHAIHLRQVHNQAAKKYTKYYSRAT